MNRRLVDVAVIGGGVIGLSTALEVARAGASCCVIEVDRAGAASGAAAGLLAPSVGHLSGDAAPFFAASLERYENFLAPLQEEDPELRVLTGLIEVLSAGERTSNSSVPFARWIDREAVAGLEPRVHAPFGAVLHARDGAIDNVRLVAALRRALERNPGAHRIQADPAVRVGIHTGSIGVVLESGSQIDAGTVVLAAGAWSGQIMGLPRFLPISPLKGQMLAVRSTGLRHPIMGDDVYLVPRAGEVVIGATAERAGFDLSTNPATIEALRQAAIRLCPGLANAPVVRQWAGLRPATPDMLPILGPDPDAPRLLYACGHSKNGILLAPATAAAIAECASGNAETWNIAPFSVTRFE